MTKRKTGTMFRLYAYSERALFTCQMFYFVFKRASDGSCFILSSRVSQRKLTLNDKDSTPYVVVFASGILQRSFFQDHMFHTFFHKNPHTIDRLMLFNNLYISIINVSRQTLNRMSICHFLNII